MPSPSPHLPTAPRAMVPCLRLDAVPAALAAFLAALLVALASAAGPTPAAADVSGFVRVAGSGSPGLPIAGATVHLQADPGGPSTVSGPDGSFTLPTGPGGPLVVAASVTYDRGAPINYTTGGAFAFDGDTAVDVRLAVLPAADDPAYTPPESLECGGCHVGQHDDWLASNHRLAATDAWVLDLFSGTGTPGGGAGYVFRDLHDPGETGFCATCHAPLADVFDPGGVMLDEVTDPAALEGVSCLGCHQVDSVGPDADALHLLGNATYRFPDGGVFAPTFQFVWGPLDDVTFGGMSASHAPVFEDSRFCASCHQYVNPDTGAPGQNTYGEWLASPFAVPGPGYRSCQDCHMPPAAADGEVCILGDSPVRPAADRRGHGFVGATPATLADSIALTTTASEAGDRLVVTAEVANFGVGHAFPSGVSIRNAILVIEARWNGVPLAQLAGPTVPFWADDAVPGHQDGDWAGAPGKGFAKVLEGRINGQGPVVRPVLFIDAEGVWADTLIPAASVDATVVELALPAGARPGDAVEVTARLLYRRAFRALAVTKGWTETPQGGPIETEVAANSLTVVLEGGGGGVVEIPALGPLGLVLLAAALALAGLRSARPRRPPPPPAARSTT